MTQLNGLDLLPSPLLILGPAYSGKSELAIESLAADKATTVIGTAALPGLESRISELKAQRPTHWRHREGGDLPQLLSDARSQSQQILVDSLNQWLANVLLDGSSKYDPEQQIARFEHEKRQILEFMRSEKDLRLVLISSEVGAGITPPQELSRLFRQTLGRLHQAIAREAASVVLVTAGIPQRLK